jgi:hypothetical protein
VIPVSALPHVVMTSTVMGEAAWQSPRPARSWRNFDRASFMYTACVEQAQMLRVRAEADGLQQHIQNVRSVRNSVRIARTRKRDGLLAVGRVNGLLLVTIKLPARSVTLLHARVGRGGGAPIALRLA